MCAAARRCFHYFCRPFNLSSLSPSAEMDGKHAETTWKLLLPVNRLSDRKQMGSGRTRRKEWCQRMTEKLKLGRGKLNGWKIIVFGQIDFLPEIVTCSNDFVTLLQFVTTLAFYEYYITLFHWFLIYFSMNCNTQTCLLLYLRFIVAVIVLDVLIACVLFYIWILLSDGVTIKRSTIKLDDFFYVYNFFLLWFRMVEVSEYSVLISTEVSQLEGCQSWIQDPGAFLYH